MMDDRTCRVCGCTDLSACRHTDGSPCGWMEDDLCSLCHDLMASDAVLDIAEERARQMQVEGWTPEHDDQLNQFQLTTLAGHYVEHARVTDETRRRRERRGPTALHASALKWFKPTDRRRDLVKAAALIVAEIERLDRMQEREGGPAAERSEAGAASSASCEPLREQPPEEPRSPAGGGK